MKQLKRRIVSYLSGVLGFFWLSEGFFRLFWEEISYEGEREAIWSFLLCCILWMLVWTRAYGVLYLLSAVLVCACPFLDISLGWAAVCLLFVSFVSLYAWDKHRAVSVAVGLLSILFALGGLIGYGQGDAITEAAFLVERYANRVYTSIVGESEELLFENGSVNRGNNYRSGNVQLDILLDQPPRESIYLRGYIGAVYTGNRWTEADETSFYRLMRERFPVAGSESRMREIYGMLYFLMNHHTEKEWIDLFFWGWLPQNETARRMIVHRSGALVRDYVPYFSFLYQRAMPKETSEDGREVYTYYYYEASEMEEDWIEQNGGRYPAYVKQMREDYAEYAVEQYLAVPTERLPRLTQLCESHPLTEVDEVTAFIRETLQADTTYTRTPGTTPFNQDVIEYFLFESKRGYCLHYASAATLMYRLYGIPARYVTGYLVYAQDFSEQEDGSYAAAVTDYRKHAWVEIYQENLGWVPVEMTPLVPGGDEVPAPNWLMAEYAASFGEGTAVVNVSDDIDEEAEEEEEEETEETEETQEEEAAEEEETEAAEEAEKEAEQGTIFLGMTLRRIVAFLILAAVLLWLRRRIRLSKLARMDVRRLFYRLMEFLRLSEEFKGYRGMEKDFPGKLIEAIPALHAEEAEELLWIVGAAAYGKDGTSASEEDREKVYALYRTVVTEGYDRLKPIKKFFCKWILNLC